ncbi:MAG: hypothetical protein ACOYNY_32330 [Caldilineaceae bacterium]
MRTPTRIVTPSQATPSLTTPGGTGNTTAPPSITVNLVSPEDSATLDNKVTLSWNATPPLPSGYLFEPVFWQGSEDPIKDGRGYAGTTAGTSLGVTAELFRPTGEGEYYWGILLVKETPYQRVTYLGGKWLLRVKLSTPGESSPPDNSPPPDDGGNRED